MLHRAKIIIGFCLLLAGCAQMNNSLMQDSVFSGKDESNLYYPIPYAYLKNLDTKIQNFEVTAAINGTIAGAAVGATAGALTGDVKNVAVGGILGGMAGGSAAYIYVIKNRTLIGDSNERFLHYLIDAQTDSENFKQVNELTRKGIRYYTHDINNLKRNRKKYSPDEYQKRWQELSDGLGILRKFYALGGEEYSIIKKRYENVVTEEKKMYVSSKESNSISESEYNKALSDLKTTETKLNASLMKISKLETEYASLEKQLIASEEEIRRLEVNIVVAS